MKDLTVKQQEQSVSEEQRITKAVAEQDAKQAQQWWEEEERRATMLGSIRAHRELTVQLPRHSGYTGVVNTGTAMMQKFFFLPSKSETREGAERASSKAGGSG